jgi:hypothetical protein
MGWDVLITIDADARDPLVALAAARPALERAASIGALRKLEVMDADDTREPLTIVQAEPGQALDDGVFERARARVGGGDVPAAWGAWEARRFHGRSSNGRVRTRRAYPDTWGVGLYAFGPGYHWPSLHRHPTALALDAGSYRDYIPSRGEAARLNLAMLGSECAALVEGGARGLRGLDAERDVDPRCAWLVFHADPGGYAEDLRRAGLAVPKLDADRILDVALSSEHVILEETSRGFIVYSARGPMGSLGELYMALAKG